MCQRIASAIVALFACLYSFAQTSTGQGWTDKNNAEQYAAYMIRIAYSELGYMGVSVQVRQEGTRRIFEVDPGRIYHIKAVYVRGRNDLPPQAMTAAPTVGDIYSAARMNAWTAAIQSGYARAASWGARFDHANAEVAIEVRLDAD
jgi:hypothetical protein